ncbi:hypothetical protein COCMIDRAFT_29407 [Bipolaris oryzae ATCC 44560]|uniref:Uncharacterized protein n=1 Tax=Bipolaris oryzae ATCC 44560 TaxID=930090 RepID=W6ZEB0_COCMI|nr:uncharacterized protein COCMIDRAFT_29407 [Bipolaris oryzae ATCC 44560]EUC41871.1 hypothetical protein COCMIDRAFT_29407 [Bipolaris oryzae ATCC 44560]
MVLPTQTQTTQTTHLHPQHASTHIHPNHHTSTHIHPGLLRLSRSHPRLSRPHARTNSSDLKSLIDQHMAWQDNAIRPGTRGTLLVDWDGDGEPLLSYRSGDVAANSVGAEVVVVVDSVDKGGEEEEEVEKGGGDVGCEEEESEEERGVREVLEEMLEKMVSRDEVVEVKGKEEEKKKRKMLEEEKGVRMEEKKKKERKVEGEVKRAFLIRRKPVPVRQSISPVRWSAPVAQSVQVRHSVPVRHSVDVQQSIPVKQGGEEGKKEVDVGVEKRLPEVPAEEQIEVLPIFYRYEEAPSEYEEVKKKASRRSVARLAEVLKKEGLEVWGMLKYEGKELKAVIKYEGKGLLQEVKEDSRELLQGWREEGRWLLVVLRNEWRDGEDIFQGLKFSNLEVLSGILASSYL